MTLLRATTVQKDIRIHPLGLMIVCTKFHVNPFDTVVVPTYHEQSDGLTQSLTLRMRATLLANKTQDQTYFLFKHQQKQMIKKLIFFPKSYLSWLFNANLTAIAFSTEPNGRDGRSTQA